MTQPGIGDLMSQWKQMSDQFMKNWGEVYESMAGSAEGQAMSAEMEKNYVAARAAMAKAARDAYGPIIEAVGAVPLTEFQRLSDQVHTIMLRMDKIDDAIQRLIAMQGTELKGPKTRKKKKTS
ncbi:MAG: hypothetical protein AB7J35_05510 [Dehalococcoidia bacterium]